MCDDVGPTSVNDVVCMAPLDGLGELVDVAPRLLQGNTVRHLFQELQHVLYITREHT